MPLYKYFAVKVDILYRRKVMWCGRYGKNVSSQYDYPYKFLKSKKRFRDTYPSVLLLYLFSYSLFAFRNRNMKRVIRRSFYFIIVVVPFYLMDMSGLVFAWQPPTISSGSNPKWN